MKGILLVTHGSLCQGIYESCEMIIGEKENIYTLSLDEEGVELFRHKLEERLSQIEAIYDDIIIVTDIPNATPYNECCRYILSHQSSAKLLSGMNLAMVIELAIFASTDIQNEELRLQVLESARQSLTKFEKHV